MLLQHTAVQMHFSCSKSTTYAALANTALMAHITGKHLPPPPPTAERALTFILPSTGPYLLLCEQGGSKFSSTCNFGVSLFAQASGLSAGPERGVTPNNTRYPGQTPVNTHTNSNKPT